MREWKDKFNSFNSEKGLLYAPWYQAIKNWKDGKRDAPLPPVEVSLDPIQACQLRCSHCNASRYLENPPTDKMIKMPDDALLDLVKFLGKWGVKAICFTGDTKVKLVNGTIKTFKELEEKWNKSKEKFEVYSRDENGNIVSGVAYNPRKTREVNEITKITLDNDKIIECTLDHKFMLKDGTYKEAQYLTTKDSLMPLYTKVLSEGYEFIMDATYQGTTHRLFSKYYEEKLDEKIVHHKNFNKLDNTKDNLQLMTNSEHMKLHARTPQQIEFFKIARNKLNHKIVSKKFIKFKTPISMYCMTVEKYHNFALDAGVFVQNCFGGGGEPTLHPKLAEALKVCHESGMDASIATNGVSFSDELIDAMAKYCRWVGISVDSASAATYKKGRKKDCYGYTINNIKKLSARVKELDTKCDVSFKFLIFKYNQTEIYGACLTAKDIGAKDFHARPADLSHQGMDEKYKGKANPYNIEWIKHQFEQCQELDDENFHVYTIVHKFDENFLPAKRFTQCYASPCCMQVCPSGEVFLCPDQRYNDNYKLGEWYPDPKKILEFWGSKKHYELVFKTGAKMCHTRCTFAPYCEQAERLFINEDDPMCKWFI